ncbi:hypothetical protein GCM10011521_28020 [Arenimonas soli]|uniref:Calx-beta domain-containing protein n=1 Tax=Arenimonas soli TaxID=2269504 RepID=A0ABQ1HS82_9GAMM|nr:Calx-beta domain-containing protein [Arenimonas soli]GGA87982.1 hypothetical protein GCM10011521_28020 [Arenimonas soli]
MEVVEGERLHPVQVDFPSLKAGARTGRLLLPGVTGSPVIADRAQVRTREDGLQVWTARVATARGEGTALLVIGDDLVHGRIPQADGSQLRLQTRQGLAWLVEGPAPRREHSPDFRLPPPPGADDVALRKQQDAMTSTGTPLVDVGVLYTPALLQSWGSADAVRARIAFLEEATNQAYADSQAELRIRVVAAQLVDYVARNDNGQALVDMSTESDLPVRAAVHRLREQHGADLVAMLRDYDPGIQTNCGIAWMGGFSGSAFRLEYSYSVSVDLGIGGGDCGDYVFAHELGHNMGAHHDIETSQGAHGVYPYSRGYRRMLETGEGFYTIMAYPLASATELGRFSNPRQNSCFGSPCGDAAEADNARGFGQVGPALAALVPSMAASGPAVSIGDVEVLEGDSGTVVARFPISLSQAAGSPVSIELATSHGSAREHDYTFRAGTVVLAPGQVSAHFDVSVSGDVQGEVDEVFSLDVVSVSGARVGKGQGLATIINDDPLPRLAVANVFLAEGDAGLVPATFTASLDQVATSPVTFDVRTFDYGNHPGNAVAGLDYLAVDRRGLRIEPGQDRLHFSVSVVGDTVPEGDEVFYLSVGNVQGAVLADNQALARIRDDDGGVVLPEISIHDASIAEGDDGQRSLDFMVSLSTAAPAPLVFGVITHDGTAQAGSDYIRLHQTGRQIPRGQAAALVSVHVRGDTLPEADETFRVELVNVSGARAGDLVAEGRIVNDDGSMPAPPMIARDDRFVVLENADPAELDVLANDALTRERLAGGQLQVVDGPVRGSASIDTCGTPNTAGDDLVRYMPAPDSTGEDVFVYRACEPGGRCTEALVNIQVQPAPDIHVSTQDGSGFRDVPFEGLRALPGAMFSTTALVAPMSGDAVLSPDPTPEYPWDLNGAGTRTWVFPMGEAFVRTRVLADAHALGGGDVDLYLGLDANRDGRADPSELHCTSATGAGTETCELWAQDGQRLDVWVMAHLRDTTTRSVEVQAYAITAADDWDSTVELRATGPGRLPAGTAFPLRLAWQVPGLPSGARRAALLKLRAGPGAEVGLVPVRLHRTAFTPAPRSLAWTDPDAGPRPLSTAVGLEQTLEAGASHDRFFIDVPAGATRLTIRLGSELPADLHLARADAPSSPEIAAAPPVSSAQASLLGRIGSNDLVIEGNALTPGRWYATVVNRGQASQTVTLATRIEASTPAALPGSYFNPDRSGHGLFLYPAGNQWAGLWYTYLQDRTPTWYYLQGEAPGESGIWLAGLHRAAWNGSSRRLTRVGQVSVTPMGADALQFTYELDGETGSELLTALGRGCPSLAGQPLDASSHWFDPARAGTGYSVQLFPDYEFFAAFVYDGQGVPRFLTSEAPTFLGADATMALEQLTGFCPLCTRGGAPTRADIGTLRRRFDAGGLVQMELDAIYTGGVPGAWTGDDAVQPLGGPGTTQGCAVP